MQIFLVHILDLLNWHFWASAQQSGAWAAPWGWTLLTDHAGAMSFLCVSVTRWQGQLVACPETQGRSQRLDADSGASQPRRWGGSRTATRGRDPDARGSSTRPTSRNTSRVRFSTRNIPDVRTKQLLRMTRLFSYFYLVEKVKMRFCEHTTTFSNTSLWLPCNWVSVFLLLKARFSAWRRPGRAAHTRPAAVRAKPRTPTPRTPGSHASSRTIPPF